MDKWYDDQIKKMQLGGNAEWKQFYESHSEYSPDMSLKDKYHSAFATEYREKLAAKCEGRSWSPSSTTTRQSTRTNTSNKSLRPTAGHSNSFHASNLNGFKSDSSLPLSSSSQKVQNEAYFSSLGALNSSRSEAVPPNQGGKYTGFGNPAFSYSASASTSAPDLNEFVNDPMGVLSKGFSFISQQVVEGAKIAAQSAETLGYTVNEKVIKPTADKVREGEVSKSVAGYMAGFGKTVTETATRSISSLSSTLSNTSSSSTQPSQSIYSSLPTSPSADGDFFTETMNHYQQRNSPAPSRSSTLLSKNNTLGSASPKVEGSGTATATTRKREKKDVWNDDEWSSW
ncbi:9178_t:CDS:2 [Paraglomus occultum]|uniref:9178_t:CDS:1 n=1 Tax=Paraglomus occultum TaxID=144539 RepID=A0A9N9AIE1_9GLOM|nr:9178_t:CDS:2 [Paraglomus occultum]